MVQVAYISTIITKLPACQADGWNTKLKKLSAETWNWFFHIPNAKNIPVKWQLAMKWLRNICQDHMMSKFNFNQIMTILLWPACFKTDLEHRLFSLKDDSWKKHLWTDRNPGTGYWAIFFFFYLTMKTTCYYSCQTFSHISYIHIHTLCNIIKSFTFL